jgi:hypothetical protein
MPSHLSPRLLRAWANRVQTGACIVRQAQERTMPEYIRPGTVSSTLAVTPAAVEVHNNVRWVCLIWGSKSDPQGVPRTSSSASGDKRGFGFSRPTICSPEAGSSVSHLILRSLHGRRLEGGSGEHWKRPDPSRRIADAIPSGSGLRSASSSSRSSRKQALDPMLKWRV